MSGFEEQQSQPTADEMMNPLMQEAAPPPKKPKSMTLEMETPAVPVAQEKQPEQLKKQPMNVFMQAIQKRIQLTLKNCRELFAKNDFYVHSTSIELVGFKWLLEAKVVNKGLLALLLHALPPTGFKGNYQIEVDYRLSILNALADNNLIEERIGCIKKSSTGWGCNMAKFKDLLDPNQKFLTPEGNIEIWADFTIKSSTLDHLT